MPEILACPDKDQLVKIALGQLPESKAAGLIEHLASCSNCATRLNSLVAEDALVDAVRSKEQAPAHPEQDAVRRLLGRVRELVGETRGQRGEPTRDLTTPTSTSLGDTSNSAFGNVPGQAEKEDEGLAPPQAPDEIGRLGPYRVLKVLGEGGMGKVFLAEDPALQRSVALKVMKPNLARNMNARKRFLQEARAAAAIEHDNIIHIYQVSEERGVPFVAMPLLKGLSLEDLLRRSGTLQLKQALRIASQIAEGLSAAHERKLIHRDIKPANIWIEPTAGGRVKILDFGLARPTEGDIGLTQSGAILGTPSYMSPEQARGEKVDHRADLYSLGCVLYRMVTGNLPLKGNDTMSMLTALATQEPTAPRLVKPDVPPALSDLIMKLLAKDPARRFGSAKDVAQAIRTIDLGANVSTPSEATAVLTASIIHPPIAAPVPAKRKPNRSLVLLAIAGVAAVLLLAGGAVVYQFLFRTTNGTLIVEVEGDADVRFKKGKLQIFDEKGNLKYELEPSDKNKKTMPAGKYQIKVTGTDGLTLDTDKFEMTRAGAKVRVTLDQAAIAAKKEAATDDDRRVAEWVVQNSGTLTILLDGRQIQVDAVAQLPGQPFKVINIDFARHPAPTPETIVDKLRGLPDLERLSFHTVALSDAALERLASLPLAKNLEHLGVVDGSQFTDAGLSHLKRFGKLKGLSIGPGDDLTIRWLKHLHELPALENLSLFGYRCTDTTLQELRGLKLKGLVVGGKDITDAGMEPLLGMSDLLNLVLGDTSISDAGLARLKALPALAQLSIQGSKVTGAGLKSLAQFPKLHYLGLNLPISDESIDALKSAKQLRYLGLVGPSVNDARAARLAGLDQLTHLTLQSVPITDTGLKHLQGIKGLEILSLSSTQVSETGVRDFAAALPKCTIIGDYATSGPRPLSPLDKDRPFVLVRSGKAVGEFKAFAGVVPNLQSGDVVTIHGNGPFELGKLELQSKNVTIQAAPGYRPRFLPHASAYAGDFYWITSIDGDLTVEGCDLVGRPPVGVPNEYLALIYGRNAALTLRKCRVMGLHGTGHIEGKFLRVEDCLLLVNYLPLLSAKTECHLQNNIVYSPSSFTLDAPGGQRVTLRNNTFCSWTGWGIGLITVQPKAIDITIAAEGNLFDFAPSNGGIGSPLTGTDWIGNAVWEGRNNLYRNLAHWQQGDKWHKGLEGWAKLTGKPEQGSRETNAELLYDFERSKSHPIKEVQALIQKATEEARQQGGRDVGPDFTLIGPGDAYLKALAGAGKPIPKDQLRPEAEVGGACILLRAGKVAGAYAKLAQAVVQAKDGDTVEVRSDGVFGDCATALDCGMVTVRAAYGYRPTIEKGCVDAARGTVLILEGLHFRDAIVRADPVKDATPDKQPRIGRLANCSFEWTRPAVQSWGAFLGAGKQPGEVVNCWMPFPFEPVGFANSRLTIRNSVLGRTKLRPYDKGPFHLDLERCTVWNMEYAMGQTAIHVEQPKIGDKYDTADITITAKQTYFESIQPLVGRANPTLRWDGSGNVFGLGTHFLAGAGGYGLTVWQAIKDTKEEGSADADPLLFQPENWRMLPASAGFKTGPGGKDFGADVRRVASP